MPITNNRVASDVEDSPMTPEEAQPAVTQPSSPGNLHPFIAGLLQTLPAPESDWSVREQAKWHSTAAGIFALLYESGDGEVVVSTTSEKGSEPSLKESGFFQTNRK